MTLTFDLGSRNIDKDMTHNILHQIPKFHKDSPKRLGGVRGHTHRHTDTQTHRGVTGFNNIDNLIVRLPNGVFSQNPVLNDKVFFSVDYIALGSIVIISN